MLRCPQSVNQRRMRARYASEAARLLLQQNAFNDLDRLFALAEQASCRHRGRAVSRISLREPDGSITSAFVKFHWGRRRLWPRWTDLKTGQIFQSLPEREWHGIGQLQALGLRVPERLALLQSGWWGFQDAVLLKQVPPPYSLDDLLRNGQYQALDQEQKGGLLAAVVRVMRRIHEAGYGWRGTCTRHLFPEWAADEGWRLWLIDCEGVHRRISPKGMARDYRKLTKAMQISGADASLLERFRQLIAAPR